MKKTIVSMLLIVVLLLAFSGNVLANEFTNSEDKYKNDVLDYVENWMFENYSEHYSLSNFSGHVAEFEINGDQIKALVPIVVFTTLKYDSVESLPYIEGMKDRLNISSLEKAIEAKSIDQKASNTLSKANPDLSVTQINNLTSILTEQYADAAECIGIATELSLDFIVYARINNNEVSDLMLYVDEMGVLRDASNYVPESRDSLMFNGIADINSFINSAESDEPSYSTKGYSSYDRVAARDYAWEYSSNATEYCNCGTLYGVDYDYWNNDEYPYISTLCHDDCTDFVSQAIHAGGIPIEDGIWDRFNDANSGYGLYGWTWTSLSALKEYMIDKGYWDDSTFALCNAGNILLTSSGHVTMVTLNDTVTHRYTAHTRDRDNYQFYDVSSYDYYTIKTT